MRIYLTYGAEFHRAVRDKFSQPTQRPSTSSEVSTKRKSKRALDNRVRVVLRVRPPIEEDFFDGEDFDNCMYFASETSVKLCRYTFDDKLFTFDRVLDDKSTQLEAYDTVASSIVQVCSEILVNNPRNCY